MKGLVSHLTVARESVLLADLTSLHHLNDPVAATVCQSVVSATLSEMSTMY
jgi:hypothetical protein